MENKKITPLFFFLSLGSVVALIVSVSAFLNLSFETLNHALPDVLTDSYQYGYMTYSYEGVRSALALLIIVFPVFLILERYWSKASKQSDLSTWNATLHRWAIYLILFLASVTILTDLVILVRYFVSGEITMRFILKIALTLLVAGSIGWYYIRKLRDAGNSMWFATFGTILALGMIVWSFSVIGSPLSQRQLRIDQRRLEDLQSIQWQIISYWQQKEKLPESFADLSNPISSYMVPKDPFFEKGRVYEYQKLADKKFQLCATFDLPMPKGWVPGQSGGIYPTMMETRDSSMPYPGPGGIADSWDHEAGRTCYERTIDPELYPPYPKPLKQ